MAQESGAAQPVLPVVASEQAEEPQGTEQSPGKKKKGTHWTTVELWGESAEQWIQARDVQIPLDELEIGVGLAKGQVRELSEEVYLKRLKNLEQVRPDRPVDVTVWNPSLTDPSMLPRRCVGCSRCSSFSRSQEGCHQRTAHCESADGAAEAVSGEGDRPTKLASGGEWEDTQGRHPGPCQAAACWRRAISPESDGGTETE